MCCYPLLYIQLFSFFPFLIPLLLFGALPFISVLVLHYSHLYWTPSLLVDPSPLHFPFHCLFALFGPTVLAALRLSPSPSLAPSLLFHLLPDSPIFVAPPLVSLYVHYHFCASLICLLHCAYHFSNYHFFPLQSNFPYCSLESNSFSISIPISLA